MRYNKERRTPRTPALREWSRRPTEIVLFPVDRIFFNGEPSGMGGGFHGEHVYDYSAAKVDRVYCTGFGSPYEYSHEMGHMVVSTARIVNGWSSEPPFPPAPGPRASPPAMPWSATPRPSRNLGRPVA